MAPILIDDFPYSPRPRYGYGQPPHRQLFDVLNPGRIQYAAVLESFLQFTSDFLEIPTHGEEAGAEPFWINGYLPGMDAAALYGFLALKRPALYLEIGSGNSTKFARRCIRRHGLPTRILSLDPSPRATVDALCDEVIRQPVEEVDLTLFDRLQEGDILFVDHSHRSFMNSDATVVFLDILPRLRPGVLVQIHDIYLPWDYPAEWVSRHYNEQYLLACYLLSRMPPFAVTLPCTFATIDPELSRVLDPLWDQPLMTGVSRHGASFWVTVR